ncbi:MAG: CDP-archaeol synthase [Luteolibacter sp.]
MSCHAAFIRLGFAPPMAETAPPSPPSKARTFVRRTASTLFLWALVSSTLISMKPWAYLALVGVLGILSTVEYFKMLKTAGIPSFPRFGLLCALAYSGGLYYLILNGHKVLPIDIDALAIFVVAAGAFTLQLRRQIKGIEALQSVAFTLLGFVYIAFLFNFSARVTFIVPHEAAVPGAIMLLWLLAVTKFTDMGAYITGSVIGRHKMIPHVSPGKTWEGFVGALFFAQLAGCGLYALFPTELAVFHSWGHVIFLGFLLAVLAVIGDLAESIVKRALGAKDSGSILPGIGGALDLIDSICFTAPALYFYLKWVLLPLA